MKTQEQQEHIEYLIAIGKGGAHGIMSLLKTPEDHAKWEANMHWFADALLASPPLPQQGGEQTDSSLPFESALAMLVGAVLPSLDSGDILDDANAAANVLHSKAFQDFLQGATVQADDKTDLAVIADSLESISWSLNTTALDSTVEKLRSMAAVLPQVGEAKPLSEQIPKSYFCGNAPASLGEAKPFNFETQLQIAAIQLQGREAKAVQDGWKLVPVSASEEMIRAACLNQSVQKFVSYQDWWDSHSSGVSAEIRNIVSSDYAAMVSAAPVAHALSVAAEMLSDADALEGVAEWLKTQELTVNLGQVQGDFDEHIESSAGWLLRLVNTALQGEKA